MLLLLLATFCVAGSASAATSLSGVSVSAQVTNPVVIGLPGTTDYMVIVNRTGNGSLNATLSVSGLPAGTLVRWDSAPSYGSPASTTGSVSFTGNNSSASSTLHVLVPVTSSASTTNGITVTAVEIGNPADTVTSGSFSLVTVNPPAPTLTSIFPTSGARGATMNVTVNGTNFVAGRTTASFSGSGITVNSNSVNSATQMVVNITIGSAAGVNARNVSVSTTSPGGGNSNVLNGAFNVTAAASTSTTTTLTGPASVTYPATVTYQASVSPPPGSGTVTFMEGATTLAGPIGVDGSGNASSGALSLSPGSHSITAVYSGTTGFAGSTSSAFSTNVLQAPQTISFAAIADKTYGDAPFTLTISGGGSGNAVTLTKTGNISLSTSSVPSTGGTVTVTITGAGPASITANQAGNTNYLAATAVTQNFNVAKAATTLTFTQADRSFSDGNFQLNASSNPTFPVTYTLLNSPANVAVSSSGAVTVTSPSAANASVQVKASVAGDANHDPAEATVTFTIKENVAPVATAGVTQGTPGNNDWYKSGPDVVVHLSATDTSGSGVDHISYTVDSVTTNVPGASADVTVTVDGTHTISFTATDNNGNVSASQNFVVKLDRTGPVITDQPARSPDHNGWYNHDVDIVFTATDATSGSPLIGIASTTTVTLTGAADINKPVAITAEDAAGNTTSTTFHYQFDATAPVAAISGVSEGGFYHDGSVTSITVTEPYEASRNMWISPASTTQGAFYDYATQSGDFSPVSSLPLSLTTEGNYTLHILVTDQAGNSNVVQDIHFTVDRSAPVITVTGVENGKAYRTNPLSPLWSLSDILDPNPMWVLQSLFGDIDSQNGFPFANSTANVSLSGLSLGQEGRFRLNLRGEDHAGNSHAIDEILFLIDYQAPSSAAHVTNGVPGDNGWYRSAVEVTLQATDPMLRVAHDGLLDIMGSGIFSFEYSFDGSSWTPIAGTTGVVNVTAQGSTTIQARSSDPAGNVEGARPVIEVKVDTVDPDFVSIPNVDGGHAMARGGKVVVFDLPVAHDATSDIASVTTVPASNTLFAIGTTTVTATAKDNAGNTHSETFTVTVQKIVQTITFAPPATATYGDAPIALVATTNATGPAIPVTFTVSGPGHLSGNNLVIDGAGNIVVTAHAVGDEDYLAAPDVQHTIVVAKKAISVTADPQTKVYGDPDPALTYTVSGLVGTDTLSGVSISLSEPMAHVATGATILVTGPDETSNYLIAYHPGTLTVTPAPLSITTNHSTREYGLANPTFTASIVGLVNGDGAGAVGEVTFTTDADQTSGVGTYDVTPGGASSTDYTITFHAGTLSITPASLTVVPNDASRDYGDANPPFSGVITGIRNNDAVTATYTTAADLTSPVGTYTIEVGTVSGTNGNYTIDQSATGTLTVNKALLTVTVHDEHITYGDAIPDPLTGTITGIKNNDAITASYSTSATAGSDAGDYAIVATLDDPNNKLSNYTLVNPGGHLCIAKAHPVVTWSPSGATVALNAFVSATSSGTSPLTLSVTTGSGAVQANGTVKATDVGSLGVRAQAPETTNYLAVDETRSYSVIYAATSGILAPVRADGTSVFKKGSTVPVKIQVFDAGGLSVSTPGTVLGLARRSSTAGTFGGVNEDIISTTPDSNFRWDATAQQWIFNLSTSNLTAGTTYVYRIMLRDTSYVEFRFGVK